jgi:NAD(P)-dependent dehydrogenase (short-subunit alcohol dehydrogenase family)
MSEKLAGKTALVTGATRGIGRAIVDLFMSNGAKVVGVYKNATDQARALARNSPDRFLPVQFDLSRVDGIGNMVEGLPTEFSKPDILVNNAGIKQRVSFLETDPEIWEQTMAVNLRAPYFLAQVVARRMIAGGRGGCIINITSQASPNLTPDSLEYGISKSGLVHVTKTTAKVLAPHGITVNALSPGRTYTDLTGYDSNPQKEQAALRDIPLHHINDPKEIAEAALFLASPAGKNITGQVIAIDGGEVIR